MTQTINILKQESNYKIWTEGQKAFLEISGNKRPFESAILAEIEIPKRKIDIAIIDYIVKSVPAPRMISLVFKYKSIRKMIEYLYCYRSKSLQSPLAYMSVIRLFLEYAKADPDALISKCFKPDGTPNQRNVVELSKLVNNFVQDKEAEGVTRSSLLVFSAELKTFFRANDVLINLPKRYSLRVTYKDRAPRPDEIQRLLEISPLREKAIISMLASGGFRISGLMSLKYKDVKEDLEAERIPMHVHIAAEFNKGKVCDYHTFVNEEATNYLRLYLDTRKKGTPKIPGENLEDDSPLFRCEQRNVRPMTSDQASDLLRHLLKRAGLVNDNQKRHNLRVHSLRKFFKTQLTALGMPTEYVEYMMGHKMSTYLDIESKGIEFLRSIYSAANLRIRPEKKAGLADVLKEIIRARGEDPSKYLKTEIMPGRTVLSEEDEAEAYARGIWEMLRNEIMQDLNAVPEKDITF